MEEWHATLRQVPAPVFRISARRRLRPGYSETLQPVRTAGSRNNDPFGSLAGETGGSKRLGYNPVGSVIRTVGYLEHLLDQGIADQFLITPKDDISFGAATAGSQVAFRWFHRVHPFGRELTIFFIRHRLPGTLHEALSGCAPGQQVISDKLNHIQTPRPGQSFFLATGG
ncbi:MAG TPA: hypothetical protein VFF68_04465 [Anaerolineaceae bacterium]|nr:hypothetical protein [Anaerolineaceae bacterium]